MLIKYFNIITGKMKIYLLHLKKTVKISMKDILRNRNNRIAFMSTINIFTKEKS